MSRGQTEGSGSADFRPKVPVRGLNIALICLGLSVGVSTAAQPDGRQPARDGQTALSAISEPVSLVLLATGLGLSARGLRRRAE